MPDEGLIREIEQFVFREARLLDNGRFHEWLGLFTDDVHYWMSGRSNRYPRSSKAITMLDPHRYDDVTDDQRGLFDEDIKTLTARVARLDTGMAWAEDPPSWTRHLFTNIEVVAWGFRDRGDGVLQLPGLSQPGGDRAGLLCRGARGPAAAGRWCMEDRTPWIDAGSERPDREELEYLLLNDLVRHPRACPGDLMRHCTRSGPRDKPGDDELGR